MAAMLEGNAALVKRKMRAVIDLKSILMLCNAYYASAKRHLHSKTRREEGEEEGGEEGGRNSMSRQLTLRQPISDAEADSMTPEDTTAHIKLQFDTGFALFLLVVGLVRDVTLPSLPSGPSIRPT